MTSRFREHTEQRLAKSQAAWQRHENYRGQDATSCRQAVTIRNRLGSGEHGGVPLWSELKSQIGRAVVRGVEVWFACHTRANSEFSISKLASVLGCTADNVFLNGLVNLVETDVIREGQSGSDVFGLVNPINVDAILESFDLNLGSEKIHQIFDSSILIDGGYPNTLTTNVGHRKFAMELSGAEFVRVTSLYYSNTQVSDISTFDPIWTGRGGAFPKSDWIKFPPPCGPKIGILTGNSPESGLTLWSDVLNAFRSCFRNTPDTTMPEILVTSLPQMGMSMELVEREEAVWLHMKKAVLDLLESGCEIITLACNTTIYYRPKIEALCANYSARFISIAEACTEEIQRNFEANGRRIDNQVGIVGIGPVIDMEGGYSGYKPYLLGKNYKVTSVNGEELAYIMKNIGEDPNLVGKMVNRFRDLISREFAGATVIVLALTEVSMVYRQHIQRSKKRYKSKYTYIDPLKELAWYLVRLYISDGFRRSEVCNLPLDLNVESFWLDRIQEIRERRI